MFTIFIILAGFKAGCPLLGIGIAALIWGIILCGRSPYCRIDKIDKYCDEYYGDINWLKNRKL